MQYYCKNNLQKKVFCPTLSNIHRLIELLKLLKAVNIAQTGGHAKMIVSEGEVVRNGEVELRKRAKIKVNETLIVGGEVCIKVV